MQEVYRNGLIKLEAVARARLKQGSVKPADYLAVKANVQKAELNVKEAKQAKIKANRAFALILNLPLEDVDSIDVLDPIGSFRGCRCLVRNWFRKALDKRPDLLAWRYGLRRAEADFKLAKANGYPDVYVLYQPYTFQNNTYLGVPSAYSWTLGVTASIPLYNRNQGNVTRAKDEHQPIGDSGHKCRAGGRERRLERRSGARAEQGRPSCSSGHEILPPAKEVRTRPTSGMMGGELSMDDYLDAQQDYNEYVRAYRDALIRHRNADPRSEHRRRRAGSALNCGPKAGGERALDDVPTTKPMPAGP